VNDERRGGKPAANDDAAVQPAAGKYVNLNLTKLRVFREVVEVGSLTRAARNLMVTQPVISAHVKGLEASLGIRLLERDGRRMVATEAGWALFNYACATLDATQSLLDEVAQYRDATSGLLRLAADATAGTYSLPSLVLGFLATRREVQVALSIADHRTVQKMTVNGAVDLAYVSRVELDPLLLFESVGHDELVLVVAPSHAWAAEASIRLSDLHQQRFVTAAPATARRQWEDDWFERRGIQRRVQLAFGHAEAAKQAVIQGFGAALLFRTSLARECREGTLVEIKLQDEAWPSTELGIVYRRGLRLTPLEKAFLDYCTTAGQLPTVA
jgi:DNA-binding transcriptional LysR family regulator